MSGVKADVPKPRPIWPPFVSQFAAVKAVGNYANSVIARNRDRAESRLSARRTPAATDSPLVRPEKREHCQPSSRGERRKNEVNPGCGRDQSLAKEGQKNVTSPSSPVRGSSLFEIVVNSIGSRNQISGYLSTPKARQLPPTARYPGRRRGHSQLSSGDSSEIESSHYSLRLAIMKQSYVLPRIELRSAKGKRVIAGRSPRIRQRDAAACPPEKPRMEWIPSALMWHWSARSAKKRLLALDCAASHSVNASAWSSVSFGIGAPLAYQRPEVSVCCG